MKLNDILKTEYADVKENAQIDIQVAEEEHFLIEPFLQYLKIDKSKGMIYELATWTVQIILDKTSYTQKDITTFCLSLPLLEKKIDISDVGVFLSTLVNNHYEKTKETKPYILITQLLETKLQYLGWHTRGAEIEIIGDAGNNVGMEMVSGKIVVKGNVDLLCGNSMSGGTLIAEKSGRSLGSFMNGGKIFVKDTDFGCGTHMTRGEIHIAREYNPLIDTHNSYGGKIYYANKLIFSKGDKI